MNVSSVAATIALATSIGLQISTEEGPASGGKVEVE
jgi:hypothetical protein